MADETGIFGRVQDEIRAAVSRVEEARTGIEELHALHASQDKALALIEQWRAYVSKVVDDNTLRLRSLEERALKAEGAVAVGGAVGDRAWRVISGVLIAVLGAVIVYLLLGHKG